MRSTISAFALLTVACSTYISTEELSAALGTDDECRATDDCALELAQLRVAKRHRDAPEAQLTDAPVEQEAQLTDAPVEQANLVEEADAVAEVDAKPADSASDAEAEATPSDASSDASSDAQQAPAAQDYGHPAWLSECKRVFVDLGCNNGVNIRKLYEPKKFDQASILSVFDQEMGSAGWRRAPGKQNGLCAFGLEPNPDHFDRLKNLEEAYQKHGWNVHFYPFAAYNVEGKMSFNKTTQRPSEVDHSTAAGAHLSMKQETTEGALEVRTVNAAEFLNSMPDGSVKLVVMDIEGAEYETLAQMMQENVLCANVVNRLLVETHGWGDVTHWGGPESFTGDTHPRSFQAVVQRMEQLKGVDWCKPGELSKVEEFDDATYAEDVDDNFGQWR